jgi:hypothetical protein
MKQSDLHIAYLMFGTALSGAVLDLVIEFIGSFIDELIPSGTKPYVSYACASIVSHQHEI